LLDEMYWAAVADGLRTRGHDAVAVVERADLRARLDPDLFAAAQAERRMIVTENLADFQRIADDYDKRGAAHFGIVLVSPSSYPRSSPRTIGRMVTALDALAGEFPADEPTSLRHWL
jgi:hypothetical protein